MASIRVLLVAPYGASGGGIGRCMEYLVAAAPVGFSFVQVESRGRFHVALSIVFLLRAMALMCAYRLSRRPSIVHVNMAEGGSVLRKGALVHLARWLGLPCVLHLHAAQIVPFYESLPPLGKRGVRGVFHSADAVVVLGEEAAFWLRRELGMCASHITIVRNGVAVAARSHIHPGSAGFHFVFLGNLVPRKGVTDLLHAMADPCLRPLAWSLTMAGGGDVPGARRLAEALGIGHRVRLAGWLGHAQAADLLARAHGLVLPSYHEGLPLVVLEALACRVAVVTTPVGALPEVLRHEETALLVAPGDREALTQALRRLLTESGLRTRIAQAGGALYEAEFTVQRFAAGICKVYRSIAPG